MDVEDQTEGALEDVALDLGAGRELDVHLVRRDRDALDQRVLDLARRRRGGEAVGEHLHLDRAGLLDEVVVRLLGELEDDRRHPLQVDDVEGHRDLARLPAGDRQALRLRVPVERVAEHVAVGLRQEVERHLHAAFAAGRRLRQRDDRVADGDDGVADADHDVLVADAQGEALAGLAGVELAAQALGERRQGEERAAGADRHPHRELAAVEGDGRAARGGRRGRGIGGGRPRGVGLGDQQDRGERYEEGQDVLPGTAIHAREDTIRARPPVPGLETPAGVW